MSDMTVAKTILEQMGGGQFVVVTGAHSLVGSSNSLSFKLPGGGGYCKNGINYVNIELTGNDDYIVTFHRVRRVGGSMTNVLVAKYDSVYFDMLQDIFEKETGLYTSLAPRR